MSDFFSQPIVSNTGPLLGLSRIGHLAAQNPGAFLAAMTEQAAAAGDSLPPAVRLQLHLWRQDFAGALAAVEELCEPPAPADPTGELGCLRAGIHERAGRAASALALLEPLTAHAGQRHRVAGIRMRALLALGRARDVLDAVEAGGFGAQEATCWPHWWRAQAWHQLGDEAAAAAALAAHEDFFGTGAASASPTDQSQCLSSQRYCLGVPRWRPLRGRQAFQGCLDGF